MLEVVDHQQQLAIAQIASETVGPGPVGPVAIARARLAISAATSAGSVSRSSRTSTAPSAVLGLETACELEAQPRLADPAGADQRDHAHVGVGQQRLQHGQFRLAARPASSPPREGWTAPAARRGRPATRRGAVRHRRRLRGASSSEASLLEHPRVQADELLAGLQAELGGEATARAGKGVQRVGLAPGSVQSQHQLTPQPLLERVRRRPATRARPRARPPRRRRGRRRRAAAAPEAASPPGRGATARCCPRRRRRTAARRGRGPAPRAAARARRSGVRSGLDPPARRTASSRARSPRRAASIRPPRARRGRRADRAAWTDGRAAPRRRWPAGAHPTARRSADRARAGRRPPSGTGPAANAAGRWEAAPIDRRARGRAVPEPQIDTRPRSRQQGTAGPGGRPAVASR